MAHLIRQGLYRHRSGEPPLSGEVEGDDIHLKGGQQGYKCEHRPARKRAVKHIEPGTGTPSPAPTEISVVSPSPPEEAPTEVLEKSPTKPIATPSPSPSPTTEPVDTPSPTAEPTATSISPEPAYLHRHIARPETIKTIAEKFYGDKDAWPRIYEANKDTLGQPLEGSGIPHVGTGQILLVPVSQQEFTHIVDEAEDLNIITTIYYGKSYQEFKNYIADYKENRFFYFRS